VTARPVVPAAFGDALRRLRRERGWSLAQAGMAAGVSTMTVARAGAYGVSLGGLPGGADAVGTEGRL
jgi:transcriptional regulator with XRE-family HTH domain